MASLQGKAAYKKKDGILAVSDDHAQVRWTPAVGGAAVTIATAHITNLQQTPDSAAKVMLKIFAKTPGVDGDPATHLFHFNSPDDPRAEANAIKDLLSRILSESRTNDPSVPRPLAAAGGGNSSNSSSSTKPATPAAGGGEAGTPTPGGSGSAAMSFAATAAARPSATASRWFDDAQLRNDIELQQSLMKTDKALHQMYMDAQKAKPASVSDAAFNAQFWATRTARLRAHAIETHQKKGAYNVLSTIKPKTVDGELKLNISLEQVQLILSQHPLVQRLYNENVPRISEAQFWSRFFLSRLAKKLRGERLLDNERADPLFDRYDETDDALAGRSSRLLAMHVPHTIDLEANEENEGGVRRGNQKDVEMRPRRNVAIVRTLNSLSEKIMAGVAPADPDPTTSAAAEVDADAEQELALRDLRGDVEARRIVLHVREQSRFFSDQDSGGGDGRGSGGSSGGSGGAVVTAAAAAAAAAAARDKAVYAQQVPAEVLFDVQADMDTLEGDGTGGLDLHAGIGMDGDSDSENDNDNDDDGDGRPRTAHVGSRAARRAAQKHVLDAVAQRRAELYGHSADEHTPMGLPAELAHKAAMTNATTTEFLKQFWNAFLSGDADRAQELAYHVESLARSQARIDAVAAEAEQARERLVEAKKEEIRELYARTGRRVRLRADLLGGGRRAVEVLLGPTIQSLATAQNLYRAALAAEGVKASTEGEGK